MACICCQPPCCFSVAHFQSLPSVSVTYTHSRLSSSLFMPNRFGSNSPLGDIIRQASPGGAQPFTSLVETMTLSDATPRSNPCTFGPRNIQGTASRPFVFYGTNPPTLLQFSPTTETGSLRVSSPVSGVCLLFVVLPPPSPPGGGYWHIDGTVLSDIGFAWTYDPAQSQYGATYYWHNYTQLDTQANPACVLCCNWLNGSGLTNYRFDTTTSSTPQSFNCFVYNGYTIRIDIAVNL